LVLEDKKIFGENIKLSGHAGQFPADFMTFPAIKPQLKFQKYRIFGYFRANLGTFFSK